MRLRLALILLCLATALPARAQEGEDPPLTLLADDIRYETRDRTLIASGNVEVFYDGQRLTAREIRYDGRSGTVTATGPVRLEAGESAILVASLAELSADFRQGLIRGARLILDRQFQVAAVEARRTRGRFNTLYTTVATSCSVCAGNPTPVWRIRARRTVHDQQERRIYFEDAWFDVFGIPVLWVPRLRVPEPGVERATGVLVPEFQSSSRFGRAVKVPLYKTLGDHADITLTPFLTTEGAAILEAEYRQRVRRGVFRLGGAVAFADPIEDRGLRGFGESAGAFDLARGFELEFDVKIASDKDFLRQYAYTDRDRLNSFISINRYRRRSFTDIRIEGFQTLRDDEEQDEIPLVLPSADYRRVWYGTPLGGRLGVRGNLLRLERVDGRDVLRAAGSVDWRGDTTLANGIQAAAVADIGLDVYTVDGDPAFDGGPQARLTPTVGAELRWPFARTTEGAVHVIEPVAQLLYSRTQGDDDVPNEDSLLPEFDETNLFVLNRFPGRDLRETGLRLNYGVNYTRYDPDGWELGLTFGQVLRDEVDPRFSDGTGLGMRTSDVVAAVSWELPPTYALVGRALFDTDLDFKRAEIEFGLRRTEVDLDLSYTYLSADLTNPVLGPVPEREVLALEGAYRVSPNWTLTGEWQYDIGEDRSLYWETGVQYGNECVEVGLSLSRSLTTSNNVPPDTEISLQVSLRGLGGTSDRQRAARRCRGA